MRLGAEGPEGRDGATLSMDFKTGNLQVCPGSLLAPGRGARMSTLPTSRSPESETSEQKAVRKGLVQRGHWHILFPSALLTPAVLQSEPLTSPEDKKGFEVPGYACPLDREGLWCLFKHQTKVFLYPHNSAAPVGSLALIQFHSDNAWDKTVATWFWVSRLTWSSAEATVWNAGLHGAREGTSKRHTSPLRQTPLPGTQVLP